MGTANFDLLSVMIEKESSKYYSCSNYLGRKGKVMDGGDDCQLQIINSNDRMALVDWCYQIIDNWTLGRETVAIAMNIADRFMCTPEAHDILYHRGKYQLVIVTSLYISIKIYEPLAFGSKDFVELCKSLYSEKKIEDMECQILQGLNWRLCCPTSLQIAHTILSLMFCRVQEKGILLNQDLRDLILEEVAFQTEVSIQEHYFMTQRPSTIAIAASLNAIEQVNDDDYVNLITALTSILREHNFDSSHIIGKVQDKLQSLVDDNSKGDDCISIVTLPA